MTCRVAIAACVVLAGCGGGAPVRTAQAGVPAADWHRAATPDDRGRLRGWRTAWIAALAQARQGGAGTAMTSLGDLLDPDHAVAGPAIPSGAYRCRTIKLGSKIGGPGFIAYPWFRCRIDGAMLTKIDGSQRAVGRIYADTDARSIFLGTLVLGDEVRPMAYARDRARDMAGVVERIGPSRWRIAFPYPRYESTLDILELVPA